jgi:hypothetical protein
MSLATSIPTFAGEILIRNRIPALAETSRFNELLVLCFGPDSSTYEGGLRRHGCVGAWGNCHGNGRCGVCEMVLVVMLVMDLGCPVVGRAIGEDLSGHGLWRMWCCSLGVWGGSLAFL